MENHPKKAVIIIILSLFLFSYIPMTFFDILLFDQIKLWEYCLVTISNFTALAALFFIHKKVMLPSVFIFFASRCLYVFSLHSYNVNFELVFLTEIVAPSLFLAMLVGIYFFIGFIQNKRQKYNNGTPADN